jgi:hypothetical protein
MSVYTKYLPLKLVAVGVYFTISRYGSCAMYCAKKFSLMNHGFSWWLNALLQSGLQLWLLCKLLDTHHAKHNSPTTVVDMHAASVFELRVIRQVSHLLIVYHYINKLCLIISILKKEAQRLSKHWWCLYSLTMHLSTRWCSEQQSPRTSQVLYNFNCFPQVVFEMYGLPISHITYHVIFMEAIPLWWLLNKLQYKTYKSGSQDATLNLIYYHRATCCDSFESPSGPPMNRSKTT